MHLRVVTVTALSFAVGMLFCSCGIQSEIFVNGEGAGEVEFRIEFSEFLLETELMEPLPPERYVTDEFLPASDG